MFGHQIRNAAEAQLMELASLHGWEDTEQLLSASDLTKEDQHGIASRIVESIPPSNT